METWKTIKDAPNYEVSDQGRVRNRRTGRILRPEGNGRRARVVLMSYGERLTVLIEDLVEQYFGRGRKDEGGTWRRVSEAWDYEVNPEGVVRNRKTRRPLKPYPNNKTGHPQITLVDAGVRLTRQIHTIVKNTYGR